MSKSLACIFGFAGHRVRVPPDPIPNSEVKPRSVSSGSVVFGHAKLGKLAALFQLFIVNFEGNSLNLITKQLLVSPKR